jgi:hypothetical protein
MENSVTDFRLSSRLLWYFAAVLVSIASAAWLLSARSEAQLEPFAASEESGSASWAPGAEREANQASSNVDTLTARALDDGLVSFSEYESAVFRTWECAESEGIVIVDVELSQGVYQYGYYDEFDTEVVNHSAPLHEVCYQKSLAPLEMAYWEQSGIIERDPDDFALPLAACLNDISLPVELAGEDGMPSLLAQVMALSEELSSAQLEAVDKCLDLYFVG